MHSDTAKGSGAEAQRLVGMEFTDKETPQPIVDTGLVHRFSEAINRSTTVFKETGERPLQVDEIPGCVLAQFGQGVWGPFQTDLPGYGGYLFGEIETTFGEPCQIGNSVTSTTRMRSVDPVAGRRYREMIRFVVDVEYRVADAEGEGRALATSSLTLLRLPDVER
jgi:hypothetical protein